MVITACAHPQTDDARGLVFVPCEPTIARYLFRKGGMYGNSYGFCGGDGYSLGRLGTSCLNGRGQAMTAWLILAAGILFGWGIVVILAVIMDKEGRS